MRRACELCVGVNAPLIGTANDCVFVFNLRNELHLCSLVLSPPSEGCRITPSSPSWSQMHETRCNLNLHVLSACIALRCGLLQSKPAIDFIKAALNASSCRLFSLCNEKIFPFVPFSLSHSPRRLQSIHHQYWSRDSNQSLSGSNTISFDVVSLFDVCFSENCKSFRHVCNILSTFTDTCWINTNPNT